MPIYRINAYLSIIRWFKMPVEQYLGSTAEFRCQLPADRVLVPGIPLPDGLAIWRARPCYGAIIRRWKGDFPPSDANLSLPAGTNRKFHEVACRTSAGGAAPDAAGRASPLSATQIRSSGRARYRARGEGLRID